MTEVIHQIGKLFELYPPWLVLICLIVVGSGLAYALWRIVKFGIVLLVTALLIALVIFAGWTLFGT